MPLILVGGLACAVAAVWNRPSTQETGVPVADALIPYTLADWQGEPIDISERVYEVLETRDVLAREYRQGDGVPVLVSVVGGLNNRNAFHPPELCYVGSAFRIVEKGKATVGPGPAGEPTRHVGRMVVEQGSRRSLVFYFFVAGARSTESYLQQQVWLLREEFVNQGGYGYLVRMETPLVDESGLAGAEQRLTSFFWEFLPHQMRLSGRSG